MKTTEINDRGFASISTPDGRFRMWVPRPTAGGKITCSCGFALGEYLPFTDAVDALAYVRVEEIRHIDEGFGYMVIGCVEEPRECMERLLEDFPELMERYLVKEEERS